MTTPISGIFEVVGGALRQYEWYERECPAPGELIETVLRTGLVELSHLSLPFALP